MVKVTSQVLIDLGDSYSDYTALFTTHFTTHYLAGKPFLMKQAGALKE